MGSSWAGLYASLGPQKTGEERAGKWGPLAAVGVLLPRSTDRRAEKEGVSTWAGRSERDVKRMGALASIDKGKGLGGTALSMRGEGGTGGEGGWERKQAEGAKGSIRDDKSSPWAS